MYSSITEVMVKYNYDTPIYVNCKTTCGNDVCKQHNCVPRGEKKRHAKYILSKFAKWQ